MMVIILYTCVARVCDFPEIMRVIVVVMMKKMTMIHDGDGYEDGHHDKMVLTIKFEEQAAEFTSGVRHGFCDQQNVLRHSRELLERRWGDNINLPFFSAFVFAVPKLEST